jgi:hypothetical protein
LTIPDRASIHANPALTLLVVPVIFAGVKKRSFVRLRRKRPEPVLVSAEPPDEAAAARVVNG